MRSNSETKQNLDINTSTDKEVCAIIKSNETDVNGFHDLSEIHSILDKLDGLQKKKTTKDIISIIASVFVGIVATLFVVFLFLMIYKNSFAIESIISVLLAFFSIFMAVFFYFKADQTSTRFYDSSYSFMKDQSVLLGRIEERFGEKFNNLSEQLKHFDIQKDDKEQKIEDIQMAFEDTVDQVISKLSTENQLTKDELNKYKEEMENKNEEFRKVRRELSYLRKQTQNATIHDTQHPNDSINLQKLMARLPLKEVEDVVKYGRFQPFSASYDYAKSAGICDENGIISPELRPYFLNMLHRTSYRDRGHGESNE